MPMRRTLPQETAPPPLLRLLRQVTDVAGANLKMYRAPFLGGPG